MRLYKTELWEYMQVEIPGNVMQFYFEDECGKKTIVKYRKILRGVIEMFKLDRRSIRYMRRVNVINGITDIPGARVEWIDG